MFARWPDRLIVLLAIAAVLSVRADRSIAAVAGVGCVMTPGDERWLRDALAAWPRVTRRFLKQAPIPLPEMVVFDARCSFQRAADARPEALPKAWVASTHKGRIAIANGPTFPVVPTASLTSLDAKRQIMLMSLPSVWRAVAPPSDIPLEQFLESVLFHELAHAFQARMTPSVWFEALKAQGYPPGILGDDTIQERFADAPAYVSAYQRERDFFFRSASSPGLSAARTLTCQGLVAMRARRARYFRGVDARLSRVDEIALTTEGLGMWIAYAWLTSERKLPSVLVMEKLRGPYWSQDEGFAMFLAIDRLVPDWQRSLLSRSPVTVEGQLARACSGAR